MRARRTHATSSAALLALCALAGCSALAAERNPDARAAWTEAPARGEAPALRLGARREDPDDTWELVEDPLRHVQVLLGERTLRDPAWSDIDEQYEFGFYFGREIARTGLSYDLGARGSGAAGSRDGLTPSSIRSRVLELDAGVLKSWSPKEWLVPYVGGGAALAWTDAKAWDASYHDGRDLSPGVYARAGLLFGELAGPFLVGVDAHYLGATSVDVDGLSASLDGWTIAVVLSAGR